MLYYRSGTADGSTRARAASLAMDRRCHRQFTRHLRSDRRGNPRKEAERASFDRRFNLSTCGHVHRPTANDARFGCCQPQHGVGSASVWLRGHGRGLECDTPAGYRLHTGIGVRTRPEPSANQWPRWSEVRHRVSYQWPCARLPTEPARKNGYRTGALRCASRVSVRCSTVVAASIRRMHPSRVPERDCGYRSRCDGRCQRPGLSQLLRPRPGRAVRASQRHPRGQRCRCRRLLMPGAADARLNKPSWHLPYTEQSCC